MRRDRSAAIALTLAAVISAAAPASAHRLDELLQAARIGIAEGRVDLELDLTPGVAIAGAIAADIDRDRDGLFSAAEQRAFVDRVFATLSLRADDAPLMLGPATFTFPDVANIRTGDGVIAIRASAPLKTSDGAHHLSFDNAYRSETSVYLANALVPETDRIAVTAQRRDERQSALTIDYRVELVSSYRAALPYLGLTGAIAVVVAVARKSPLR